MTKKNVDLYICALLSIWVTLQSTSLLIGSNKLWRILADTSLSHNTSKSVFYGFIRLGKALKRNFDNISVSANCVVLAIDAPLPYGDKTELTKQLVGIEENSIIYLTLFMDTQESTEVYFLGIFTVEASLKILALGLILHRGSYLRNMWNIMDFVVVVTG